MKPLEEFFFRTNLVFRKFPSSADYVDFKINVCSVHIPNVCFAVIKHFNRWKDNRLSSRLHALADRYDTRPSNEWQD